MHREAINHALNASLQIAFIIAIGQKWNRKFWLVLGFYAINIRYPRQRSFYWCSSCENAEFKYECISWRIMKNRSFANFCPYWLLNSEQSNSWIIQRSFCLWTISKHSKESHPCVSRVLAALTPHRWPTEIGYWLYPHVDCQKRLRRLSIIYN